MYLQFASNIKPQFDKVVMVGFLVGRFDEKCQIDQKSTKRIQPLLQFLVPRLTLMG